MEKFETLIFLVKKIWSVQKNTLGKTSLYIHSSKKRSYFIG